MSTTRTVVVLSRLAVPASVRLDEPAPTEVGRDQLDRAADLTNPNPGSVPHQAHITSKACAMPSAATFPMDADSSRRSVRRPPGASGFVRLHPTGGARRLGGPARTTPDCVRAARVRRAAGRLGVEQPGRLPVHLDARAAASASDSASVCALTGSPPSIRAPGECQSRSSHHRAGGHPILRLNCPRWRR